MAAPPLENQDPDDAFRVRVLRTLGPLLGAETLFGADGGLLSRNALLTRLVSLTSTAETAPVETSREKDVEGAVSSAEKGGALPRPPRSPGSPVISLETLHRRNLDTVGVAAAVALAAAYDDALTRRAATSSSPLPIVAQLLVTHPHLALFLQEATFVAAPPSQLLRGCPRGGGQSLATSPGSGASVLRLCPLRAWAGADEEPCVGAAATHMAKLAARLSRSACRSTEESREGEARREALTALDLLVAMGGVGGDALVTLCARSAQSSPKLPQWLRGVCPHPQRSAARCLQLTAHEAATPGDSALRRAGELLGDPFFVEEYFGAPSGEEPSMSAASRIVADALDVNAARQEDVFLSLGGAPKLSAATVPTFISRLRAALRAEGLSDALTMAHVVDRHGRARPPRDVALAFELSRGLHIMLKKYDGALTAAALRRKLRGRTSPPLLWREGADRRRVSFADL
jgi:hypothetical protein